MRVRPALSDDDDDVVVTLVSHRGAPADDTLRSLLRGADGVVLVVDATPDARERNKDSVLAVRRALVERGVPVVVQVNKMDLAEAIPASELLDGLDVRDWPHVEASARTGQGVEETLHQVVFDAMQSLTRSENEATPAFERLLPDENPLLGALRQVLESTVEVHVARLTEEFVVRAEQRLDAKLDEIVARVERRLTAEGDALAARVERRLDAKGDELTAAVERRLGAKGEELATAAATLSAVAARVAVGGHAFRHQLVTSNDELLRRRATRARISPRHGRPPGGDRPRARLGPRACHRHDRATAAARCPGGGGRARRGVLERTRRTDRETRERNARRAEEAEEGLLRLKSCIDNQNQRTRRTRWPTNEK